MHNQIHFNGFERIQLLSDSLSLSFCFLPKYHQQKQVERIEHIRFRMNNNNSLFSLCLVASYHPISYWQLQFALLLSAGCHYYQRRTSAPNLRNAYSVYSLCCHSLANVPSSANQQEYTGNFSLLSFISDCQSVLLFNMVLFFHLHSIPRAAKSIFINLTHKRAKIRRDCVLFSMPNG